MKYLSIILLVLIAFISNAQDAPTINDKIIDLKKNLEKRKLKIDSLKLSNPDDSLKLKIPRLDSAGNKINPLQSSKYVEKISTTQDSLTNKISAPLSSVTEGANKQASGIQNKIQANSDSLNQKLNNKINGLQSKSEDKISKASDKIGEKKNIDLPSSEKKLPDIPQQNLLDVKIPGANKKLPNVNLDVPGMKNPVPGLDKQLPNTDRKSLPAMDKKIPELKMDIPGTDKLSDLKILEIKTELPTLRDSTGKPNFEVLDKVTETEKVKEVTDKVDELSGLKEEGEKYKEQLQELKETKIEDISSEDLEQEATRIAEVKEIDAKTQELKALQAKQEALLQRYSDKKLIQEELKRKAANVVNDQLTKFSPAIKDAQSDISKTKKVYESSALVKDSVKRIKRENSMAGKPLKKRIVPGITFQTYSGNDEVLFDLSPQIGYRLTSWLTAGVAGVYRVGVGKANPSFIASENIYGYRIYADYLLVRGIFIHADFESLQVQQTQVSLPEFPNENVLGSYFGLGKRYSISRNIQGSLLGLFRVNYAGSISGQSKFAIRVGFDYVFKKKRKLIG